MLTVGGGDYSGMKRYQVADCRLWMRRHMSEHVDVETLEVNMTGLAEACAAALHLEALLEIEANLWDVALEEADRHEVAIKAAYEKAHPPVARQQVLYRQDQLDWENAERGIYGGR